MDDEMLLLGEPDTPETVQKRVFSLLEMLAEGEKIDCFTEKDSKDVEDMLEKIRKGLRRAKKTMVTEDDLLMANMTKLSFQSPSPHIKTEVPSKPSRQPSISSLEELDYEESLNGSSDEGVLRIDTGSRRESMERKSSSSIKSKRRGEEKEKTSRRHVKQEGSGSGLKFVINRQVSSKRRTSKRSFSEDDVIVLSSDSEWESSQGSPDTVIPSKRPKIVFDLDSKERNGSDGDDEGDEEDNNVSKAEFLKKLTDEKPYLKLRASKMAVSSEKAGLTYPLGVTFDKVTETWFITNSPFHSGGTGLESKVLKIYVGKDTRREKYIDVEDKRLENPSAITVYKEGSQVAVLCINKLKQPAICLINFKRHDKVSTFCSWKQTELGFDFDARGLARTKGGNLVTTDRPFDSCPRLRLFSRKSSEVKQKTFNLTDADIPCFIASSDDTVIITDLGTQTVMMIHLDDSDWDHVKFEITRIITSIGVNFRAEEMLNNQYFIYVSGAQIDKHGNIIIADAKNHHFKLFKPGMSYVSRISTDFPVPYVSSFHVNQHGECLILSTRETQKIHFAKLTSTNRLERHIKSGCGARIGVRTPLSSKRLSYKKEI